MVSFARSALIPEGETGFFHCYSQCVRQAFLLGKENSTGADHSHRRAWIKEFEKWLAGLFAVEVGFRGEMSNHIHVILRSRPDVVETWSDWEVIRRWLVISKLVKALGSYQYEDPKDSRIAAEIAKPGRVEQVRRKLSSISAFMGALCEHIARKCNLEDGTKGHFWSERFGSRMLEDEPALILCGVYVDLNQIRAGEVITPEESLHTSIYDRIQSFLWEEDSLPPDSWMSELTVPEESNAEEHSQRRVNCMSGLRASDLGLIRLDRASYIKLVDWSGRQIAQGKRGAIPTDLAPIMERIQIDGHKWLEAIEKFDDLFGRAIGRFESLTRRAAALGRNYIRGARNCQAIFG